MDSVVLFKTKRHNHYLYNVNTKRFLFIHPVLAYLLAKFKKGEVLEEWINNLPDDNISIDNYGPVTRDVLLYHYHKYLLFSA